MTQGTSSLSKPSAERRPALKLSGKFVPAFWDDADGRLATVKRIKRRLAALRKDADADNTQKELLVQRAVFLSIQLESMERQAVEGQPVEAGVYAMACNSLLGLLRALGLKSKSEAKRLSLKEYVEEKDGDK
jgi:hypothetical protein